MIRTIRSRVRSRSPISVALLAVTLAFPSQIVVQAGEGDLDTTFGTGGKVTIDIAPGSFDEAGAVAVLPDGRIILGSSTFANGHFQMVLTRLRPDGVIDTGFGVNGHATAAFPGSQGERATALTIQSDGKIVVAGSTGSDFAVVRFASDGSLDTTFGTGGLASSDLGGQDRGFAVVLQSDGKIVVAGERLVGTSLDFAVVRYSTNGSLDTSSDGDGVVTTTFAAAPDSFDSARAVNVQADGRIVVAGSSNLAFALARYTSNGALDTTFGIGGLVTTDLAIDNFVSGATDLIIQPDGHVLAGGTGTGPSRFSSFALIRYEADGSLDTAFGTGGSVLTPIGAGTSNSRIVGIAVQADGKIVAAGNRDAGTGLDFAAARYEANGDLDTSFGVGGTVVTDINSSSDRATGMALQPDGRLLVVGTTNQFLPVFDIGLVRYEGPPPHDLTFFPRGRDLPGTSGPLTMTQKAPPLRLVFASGPAGQSWLSDPVVNGAFVAGATVTYQVPCVGFRLPQAVRVSTTDAAGANEQVLGETSLPDSEPCFLSPTRIDVAVTVPATVSKRRLKLTVRPLSATPVVVTTGANTFLRATNFVGVP